MLKRSRDPSGDARSCPSSTGSLVIASISTLIAMVFGTLCAYSLVRFKYRFKGLIGRLILFGFTWALLHHLLGGLRHLIWDTGRGLEPGEREFFSWATLLGSVTLTIVVWALALMTRS